jgi:hypothetical protein
VEFYFFYSFEEKCKNNKKGKYSIYKFFSEIEFKGTYRLFPSRLEKELMIGEGLIF